MEHTGLEAETIQHTGMNGGIIARTSAQPQCASMLNSVRDNSELGAPQTICPRGTIKERSGAANSSDDWRTSMAPQMVTGKMQKYGCETVVTAVVSLSNACRILPTIAAPNRNKPDCLTRKTGSRSAEELGSDMRRYKQFTGQRQPCGKV